MLSLSKRSFRSFSHDTRQTGKSCDKHRISGSIDVQLQTNIRELWMCRKIYYLRSSKSRLQGWHSWQLGPQSNLNTKRWVAWKCDQLTINSRINSTHVYEMGYCTFHLILTQFILYSVKYFTSQDWLNLQVSLVLQTNMKTLELHPLWVLNIPTVGFETWFKPTSKKIPPVTPLRAGGLLWEDVWATSHCFSVMEAN